MNNVPEINEPETKFQDWLKEEAKKDVEIEKDKFKAKFPHLLLFTLTSFAYTFIIWTF